VKSSLHKVYIGGSLLAAIIATWGIFEDSPIFYGIIPGIIGGALSAVAAVRFFKFKIDLAGFAATTSGFVYYQAFQANPATLPDFTTGMASVEQIDRATGIFLGNFTAGMLLIAFHLVSAMLKGPIEKLVPTSAQAKRADIDGKMLIGFLAVFAVVACPNVLFGKVVVGAIKNIIYQRATWSDTAEFSGFETWGGPVGNSLLNMILWATSMFLLWIYLLGSRFRMAMLLLGPLVLLWTASVALQGSRTYLVTIGFGLIVYFLGNPKFGFRAVVYGAIGLPVMFVLLQISTLFRAEGIQSIDAKDLLSHIFEIRGNEGTSNQMDGLEFFRTEYLAKQAAPNPLVGFVRGMVERPIEGVLIPLPRSVFPWKPVDETAGEFSIYYQNVRLGYTSDEAFMGASPGLMGRELIRYGFLGPLTVLFWLGLVLALADMLYSTNPTSDFNRIFATVLITFFIAQMRDWVPLWFLPFLPAILVVGFVARGAKRLP
jgi:hypothetical protein